MAEMWEENFGNAVLMQHILIIYLLNWPELVPVGQSLTKIDHNILIQGS